MSKTFFTADNHYGHKNILRLCGRPFPDIFSHDQTSLKNWNEKVSPEDTVWHLGDISYACKPHYFMEILEQLNGNIKLITGNHEGVLFDTIKYMKNRYPDKHAKIMKRLKIYGDTEDTVIKKIHIEGQTIILAHYGMRTWPHAFNGSWHLFGHSHGNLPPLFKSIDVGVDNNNFTPISFEEIKSIMDARGEAFREI